MLGDTFKNAREARGVSASEAAAETRMKVQHIEALEQEDFSSVAAPAYAKGFIRLYSDYLELDSEPLIQEYVERFMPQNHQVLMPEEEEGREQGRGDESGSGFSLSDLKNIEWPFTFSKRLVGTVLGGAAAVIVLVMLFNALSKNREAAPEKAAQPVQLTESARPSSLHPVLIQGPPEPFIDLYESRQDPSP